ncbi:MAG: energy transducer TonB [Brevinematales bacterium]|nr:energy transducer TonB [Brevinematales bacterium]
MKEIDLKNSFYISLAIHLFLFLLFSLFFLKNPFQKIETPTVINIQFDNQISGNQMNEIKEPAPVIQEKKVEEKVKEKITPTKKEPKKNEILKKEVQEKKEKLERNISEKSKEKNIPETGNKENTKEEEDDDLLKNIDEAIKKGNTKNNTTEEGTSKSDVLSGGQWSGKARRTIFFPDIQSRLPDELRKKGIGYAVTARIKFDKNGLATYVEIIKSSGNSKVDQIFNTELKKIRVEPAETTDEVIHTFRIQIR